MAGTRRFHLCHQTLLTCALQGVSLQAGVQLSRGVTQTWQGSVTACTSRRGAEEDVQQTLSCCALESRRECSDVDRTVLTNVSSMVW